MVSLNFNPIDNIWLTPYSGIERREGMIQQMSEFRKRKNAERLGNCQAKLQAIENQKLNEAESAEDQLKGKRKPPYSIKPIYSPT